MLKPRDFFDAVAEYDRSANNTESKGHPRFATVDSAYAGTGPARLIFDGESALTNKAYNFAGSPPVAGARVFVVPVANTYLISGMLNGGA
jgi:hypothetical protein